MEKNSLQHHGILGQRWGVRRYENPDGTLTEAGKKRYATNKHDANKLADKALNRYIEDRKAAVEARKEYHEIKSQRENSKAYKERLQEMRNIKEEDYELDTEDIYDGKRPPYSRSAQKILDEIYFAQTVDSTVKQLLEEKLEEIEENETSAKAWLKTNELLTNYPVTAATNYTDLLLVYVYGGVE